MEATSPVWLTADLNSTLVLFSNTLYPVDESVPRRICWPAACGDRRSRLALILAETAKSPVCVGSLATSPALLSTTLTAPPNLLSIWSDMPHTTVTAPRPAALTDRFRRLPSGMSLVSHMRKLSTRFVLAHPARRLVPAVPLPASALALLMAPTK